MNLLYDDGERENKVPLSLVRLQGRGDAPKAAESDESDSGTDADDAVHEFPGSSGRVYPAETTKGSGRGDGWEVRGRIVHAWCTLSCTQVVVTSRISFLKATDQPP